MKIINKLTLRYLKQNKKRTIFTILSIVLSVIMINAVGVSLNSGLSFYKETLEINKGTFHYQFISHNSEVFDLIKNDEKIKDYYFTNTNYYSYGSSEDRISLKKGDQTFFKNRNIKKMITEGRLPNNPKEIVLSYKYLNINKINKKIGDTITLKTSNQKEQTFQIVGLMNEYSATNHYEVSYNAISYVDLNNGEDYTISIEDKDISKNIFTHAEELSRLIGKYDKIEPPKPMYNSSYLGIQNIFEENSHSTFLDVYKLVAIIILIIIIASVFIIYQAFNLSTTDRIQYLGMLSSVGATPKQKKKSVYFEGIILTFIAIPLGLVLSYIGLFITFTFINQLDVIQNSGTIIYTRLSLQYTLIAVMLAILTVFISLILPARRLSKITVIDALKKDNEVKVKRNKLKIGFIQRKILNFNQQLAIKNYKRQGKRSKVIIFSLSMSIILFVSLFSFTRRMNEDIIGDVRYDLLDVTVNIAADQKEINQFKKILKNNEKVKSYYYWSREYDFNAVIDFSYYKDDIKQELSLNDNGNINLFVSVIDDEHFKDICEENNIQFVGKRQALINEFKTIEDSNLKVHEFSKKVDKNFIKKMNYEEYDDKQNNINLPLFDSIDTISKDTYHLLSQDAGIISIIVPMSYFMDIDKNIVSAVEFCIKAEQHQELCEDLNALNYEAFDYTQSNNDSIQTLLVMQIFLYGFICLVILFAILNIVNMMSASIDKRQKELAMMLSVGMSPLDIKKMILHESLIYGFKSLLYGTPVGILIEWLMYGQILSLKTREPFTISYQAYIISFIVIMIIMLVTFRVSLKRISKQNIIESLKDDN